MKRLGILVLASALGCAAREEARLSKRVAVRVSGTGAVAIPRSIVERVLESQRSEEELFAEAAAEELESRGTEVVAGDAVDRLEVDLRCWDFTAAQAGGNATVEFTLTLRSASGEVLWTGGVPRRSVSLRAGEARDSGALVRRLLAGAMRSLR